MFATLFVIVVLGDVAVVAYGFTVGYVYYAPKTYDVAQSIGFANQTIQYGSYEVSTLIELKATSQAGVQFFQYERIHLKVNATIYSNVYQNAKSMYFWFENAQVYNVAGNTCAIQGVGFIGIQVFKYKDGESPIYFGEGDICFSYSGNFVPVFNVAMVSPSASTPPIRLHQGIGGTYNLYIAPIQSLADYLFGQFNVTLTIGLYFFGLLESYHVLLSIYPKGFPERIRYKENDVNHFDSQPDFPDREQNGESRNQERKHEDEPEVAQKDEKP